MDLLRHWCSKHKKDITLKTNYELGSTHGYKCKAVVKYFITVSSPSLLLDLLSFIKKKKIKYVAMGGGSNILFKNDYNGAVIFFKNENIEICELEKAKDLSSSISNEDDVFIKVGASVSKKTLTQFCVKNNLSGIEFWSGIPGLVGGGVAMNAGAYGKDISSAVHSVEVVVPSRGIVELKKEDIKWHYRGVDFPNDTIITAVYFKFNKAANSIEPEVNKYSNDRKQKHPLMFPSCGSVFKNPGCTSGEEGLKSWDLIQKSGLAGFSVGGARISLMHTNFIINQGGAKSTDFLKLIEEVQKRVKVKFDVMLEAEVRVV